MAGRVSFNCDRMPAGNARNSLVNDEALHEIGKTIQGPRAVMIAGLDGFAVAADRRLKQSLFMSEAKVAPERSGWLPLEGFESMTLPGRLLDQTTRHLASGRTKSK